MTVHSVLGDYTIKCLIARYLLVTMSDYHSHLSILHIDNGNANFTPVFFVSIHLASQHIKDKNI